MKRRLAARARGGRPAITTLLTLAVLAGCRAPVYVSPESPLGQARGHLAAGRFAEARDAFEALAEITPDDPRVFLGLGAAFEGLGELDSAEAIYTTLHERDLSQAADRVLDGRERLLARRRMQEAAHQAIANETRLVATPPRSNTIAVLPIRYLGGNEELRPLERALAQFVVADLSQVASLTLLEREAMQFLLDEMELTEQGIVDAATGARSGRLLRAEHVVQGSLAESPGSDELRLDGDAVRSSDAEVAASAAAEDELERLFDMEKDVVLRLLADLGIVVTPLERERIAERPTVSLLAFLAFGEGLELEDRGAFHLAEAAYERARAADPGFQMAAERAEAAASMAAASELSLLEVAGLLDLSESDLAFLTDNLNNVMGSGMRIGDRMQDPRGEGPPDGRDGMGEVGGDDRLGGVAELPITVKRP
ncbi:MAG: tetratricopeptide repeat protein [Gemmatimonadales bacterium]|jgi:TolB-like protein